MDKGDPLAIGGPARVKVIEVAEGELVRLAAGDGDYVEMIELIGGAGRRGIDDALAVFGDVPCIKR